MSEQYCQRSLVDTVALVACSSYLTAVTTLKLNVAIREHEINTSTHTHTICIASKYGPLDSVSVSVSVCMCVCVRAQ